MSKVRLHPDVVAIKRAAPKWAKWLIFTDACIAWWTNKARADENDSFWGICDSGVKFKMAKYHAEPIASTAIDLQSGSVYLKDVSGKITIVPQSVWVAARKRKSRK